MAGITFTAITPRKKVAAINSFSLYRSVHRNMEAHLENIKKIMQQNYDQVTPSPSYIRRREDGGIYSGWEINVSADGTEGTLTNEVRGAAYVQGPRRLTGESTVTQLPKMRRLGWKSITDVSSQQHASYVRLMTRAILGEENA